MRRAGWASPAVAKAVLVLVLLAPWLAACSHSDPTLPHLQGPTTTVDGDLQRAERVAVHLEDLPAGWTSRPFRPDPNQDQLDAALASCLGLPSFKPYQTAHVHSDDFTPPGGAQFPQVTSEVSTFTDDRYPTEDLAALNSEPFPACAAAQYRNIITNAGQQVGDIKVSALPAGLFGDPNRVVGFRAKIAMVGRGQPDSLVVDVVALVGPRIGVTVTFTNATQPSPVSLEEQLTTMELARVVT